MPYSYWAKYYDSLWQAVTTLAIHSACALILLILLIITVQRFFNSFSIFNICNLQRAMYKPAADLGRVSDVSEVPSASAYSNSKSNRVTSTSISTTIKLLTTLSLSLMFLYSAISFIIRMLMVCADIPVSCVIREYTIGFAFLGRICLLSIWLHRIFTSFRDTVMAYPTKLLLAFSITALVLIAASMFYFFIEVERHRESDIHDISGITSASNGHCQRPGYSATKAVLPYFLCEFGVTATLVFMMNRKLLFSLRLCLPDGSASDTMDALKSIQMVQLMAKMTLLMAFTFVSTLLIVTVMVNYLSSACISLDNLVNVISMLLLFKRNQAIYHAICCCCSRLCVQCCLLCCTRNIGKIDRRMDLEFDRSVNVTPIQYQHSRLRKNEMNDDTDNEDVTLRSLRISDSAANRDHHSNSVERIHHLNRIHPRDSSLKQEEESAHMVSMRITDSTSHSMKDSEAEITASPVSGHLAFTESVEAGYSGYLEDDDDGSSDSANMPNTISSSHETYLNTLAIIFLNETRPVARSVSRVPYFS